MRTRIKICGLTRVDDVRAVVDAGADAVGFVFAASPRQVTIEQAIELAALVPPPVARIGVFVDAAIEEIELAVRLARLSAVQLCGDETPEFCSAVSVPVIKVHKVGTGFAWTMIEPYRGHAAAQLLDTRVTDKAGGTAKTFNWHAVGESPGWASVFVAGGLTPSNVAEAVRAMRPFAVDVSSGVESAPGLKDPNLIAQLCAGVRAVDREVSQ
jgi:phosphoribosylanthranilate isomerase